jgi:hypothetical protein
MEKPSINSFAQNVGVTTVIIPINCAYATTAGVESFVTLRLRVTRQTQRT